MPIGNDLSFSCPLALTYLPLEMRPSSGFMASSGICHLPPFFTAPGILPFLHRSFTVLSLIPHSKAFCLQVFIYITSLYTTQFTFAYYIKYSAIYQLYVDILRNIIFV